MTRPLALGTINVGVAFARDVYALTAVEIRDAHVNRVPQDIEYGARVPLRAGGEGKSA
jgi:hypothetical protein